MPSLYIFLHIYDTAIATLIKFIAFYQYYPLTTWKVFEMIIPMSYVLAINDYWKIVVSLASINRLLKTAVYITSLITKKLCRFREYCSLLISCNFYVPYKLVDMLCLLNEPTLFSLECHFYIHYITIVEFSGEYYSHKLPIYHKNRKISQIIFCTLDVSLRLWWKIW